MADVEVAPKNHVAEGKARCTLNPNDLILRYLTPAYEEGVLKYYRESWRKGFYVSVMTDAMYRHIEKFYYQGEDWDPEAEKMGVRKHHLAAVIFCALSILNTLETRPELDDRFSNERGE